MTVTRAEKIEIIRAAVKREVDVLVGDKNYVAATALDHLVKNGTDDAVLRFAEICLKAASMEERFAIAGDMEVST